MRAFQVVEHGAPSALQRNEIADLVPGAGRIVSQVATGIVVDGASNVPLSAPPRLGEHTDAVLRGLRGPTQTQIRQTEGSTR